MDGMEMKLNKKTYSLSWYQYITLKVDRPPWYQRIFGYKRTISKWVLNKVELKGIDPDEFEFMPKQEGCYDAIVLEENIIPISYCEGDDLTTPES